MRIVTAAACALVVLCCSGQARADGTLISWGPRDLEGMTEARWEAAKRRPAAEVLALNTKLTSWPEAYEVLLGASAHQTDKSFLRALVSQLSNRTTVKLANTSRLIVSTGSRRRHRLRGEGAPNRRRRVQRGRPRELGPYRSSPKASRDRGDGDA